MSNDLYFYEELYRVEHFLMYKFALNYNIILESNDTHFRHSFSCCISYHFILSNCFERSKFQLELFFMLFLRTRKIF